MLRFWSNWWWDISGQWDDSVHFLVVLWTEQKTTKNINQDRRTSAEQRTGLLQITCVLEVIANMTTWHNIACYINQFSFVYPVWTMFQICGKFVLLKLKPLTTMCILAQCRPLISTLLQSSLLMLQYWSTSEPSLPPLLRAPKCFRVNILK